MGFLPPGFDKIQNSVLTLLPLSIFLIAVIVNLNNWIFYYFKIGEMASHVDQRAQRYADKVKLTRVKTILNYLTTFFALATALSLGHLQIHITKI